MFLGAHARLATRWSFGGRRLRHVVGALLLMSHAYCVALPAQADSSEYELKAAFIARFVEFIDWPSIVGGASRPFSICVFGAHPIEQPLAKLPELLHVKGNEVEVHRIMQPEQATECGILFIPSNAAASLPEIRRVTQNSAVLTIGDTPGFLQRGVLINFFTEDERLRFEIQLPNARAAGFTVSARLLKLARVIEQNQ